MRLILHRSLLVDMVFHLHAWRVATVDLTAASSIVEDDLILFPLSLDLTKSLTKIPGRRNPTNFNIEVVRNKTLIAPIIVVPIASAFPIFDPLIVFRANLDSTTVRITKVC